MFFRKHPVGFAIGGRGTGKTLLAGINHVATQATMLDVDALHAASTRVQSQVIQKYLKDWSRDRALHDVFIRRNPVRREQASFSSGGDIRLVTGSAKGVSGQHPEIATFDEIEFWDQVDIEQIWACALPRKGRAATTQLFSTRQRAYGAAAWLSREAPKRGIPTYIWTIFETMQRCKSCIAIDEAPFGSDEDRCKICPLWSNCHGKRGTKSTGWMPREEVVRTKLKMGGDAPGSPWLTQMLCLAPSTSGLVFHNFVQGPAPDGNFTTAVYDPHYLWFAWNDPAEGQWDVTYFVQLRTDTNGNYVLTVFDELCLFPCSSTLEAKKKFHEKCLQQGYGDPTHIIVDPRKSDSMSIWRDGSAGGMLAGHSFSAMGPSTKHADGGAEIVANLKVVREYICSSENAHRTLRINPVNCPYLTRAITEYHYPEGKRSNADTMRAPELPDKQYKDFIDPVRYGIMHFHQQAESYSDQRALRSGGGLFMLSG